MRKIWPISRAKLFDSGEKGSMFSVEAGCLEATFVFLVCSSVDLVDQFEAKRERGSTSPRLKT